jgi:peptidoglycan hydrolase-like protein with peptidoglycan-binding domain
MLTNQETMQKVIRNETMKLHLKQGSRHKTAIRALQNLLQELGFGTELNWEKYGADGDYGKSTVRAVKAFTEQNSLKGNGEAVTPEIAEKLCARFDIVDDMRHLENAMENNKIKKLFYRGSFAGIAIAALQTLLNELGFGAELNWEKYGADGDYGKGTVKAVKAFAESKGVKDDGSKLTPALAQKLLDKFTGFYGKNWDNDSGAIIENITTASLEKLAVREIVEKKRTRLYVSNGTMELKLTRFKKGAYSFGRIKPIDFISSNQKSLTKLPGLTDSSVNIMVAVAENEGNLDAINTWDNSFMTFGMFQWTAGARQDPGELPALIKKVKKHKPGLFAEHYGKYGLDIVDTNEIAGYFTLNGKKLMTPAEKEALRAPEWAFIFWLSGQDPEIQSLEIQHALSRIAIFYRTRSYRPKGYYIADLVTSEYGIGLLLDNHVNRPGYIKGCLEKALEQTGLSDPKKWGTEQEQKLIKTYLKIRETYGGSPMTDAKKRAAVTKKYLAQGVISDKRGSFDFRCDVITS